MSVTIVSPSGNPEVWPDNMLEKKLKEGYITFEEHKAKIKVKADAEHQIWLTSPDTIEERKQMLRDGVAARLVEYDKAKNQLERQISLASEADKPVLETKLAEWHQYAEQLCGMTDLEGAPWDGGGELTPWPTMPTKPTKSASIGYSVN